MLELTMISMNRFLVVTTMILLLCNVVAKDARCEDFQSVHAKKAAEEYQEALRSAKKSYLKNLEVASSLAAEDENLVEVTRIKKEIESMKNKIESSFRTDGLSKTRRVVQNSTYTWTRANDPDRLLFSENGKVATQKGSQGVWEVLEPDLVILKFGKNLFLLKLTASYGSFKVIAFGPIKSSYKSGKRLK